MSIIGSFDGKEEDYFNEFVHELQWGRWRMICIELLRDKNICLNKIKNYWYSNIY
jgi:hypothetical protein